jgi:CBS domain-containing protein
MVTAQNLMKQDLATVHCSASVSDVAKLMRERKIGSVFVEKEERIIGIVTETDVVRRVIGIGHMPGFVPVVNVRAAR